MTPLTKLGHLILDIRHKDSQKLLYSGKIADLKGMCLVGADLRDANFERVNLCGVNFSKADLQGANFAGAYLKGSNFTGADLTGANFNHANLAGVVFIGADLRDANFAGANSDLYQFIGVYGIGSQGRQTLYIPELDRVWCGCFAGTLDSFLDSVTYAYGSKHRNDYAAAVVYLSSFSKDGGNPPLYGVNVYWGVDFPNDGVKGLSQIAALDLFRSSLNKWERDGGGLGKRPYIFVRS